MILLIFIILFMYRDSGKIPLKGFVFNEFLKYIYGCWVKPQPPIGGTWKLFRKEKANRGMLFKRAHNRLAF